MARRSQSQTDRALADLVCARWRVADDERKPRITAWNESYKNHDPAWIDPTEVVNPPKLKYPYLHRVTTTQTAVVMEATDGAPRWMFAQSLTPGKDQQRRSEAVTEYMENVYRKKGADVNGNNRMACKRVAMMGLKYGNSDFYVRWNERWGCAQWEALDPYDVWRDADYGRFYIIRRVVPLYELKSIADSISAPMTDTIPDPQNPAISTVVEIPPRDGGVAQKAFKTVERAIKNGKVQNNIYTIAETSRDRRHDYNRVGGDQDFTSEGNRFEDDPFNATVTVLEYYETDADGIIAKIIPGYDDGDNLVFQAERNPYGACPIVPFVPYRVDCEYYGIGNGEVVGNLAKAKDWALREGIAAGAAMAWPPLLYNRRAALKKQYFDAIYGLAIEVSDVDRDMKFMPTGIGPAMHNVIGEISREAMDFGTGNGAHDPVKVGQARNATAAAIAESFGNIADRQILGEWRETMEQLAHVTIAVTRIHTTESKLVPILGRRTAEFIEILPRYLDGEWTVTFGGTSQGAQQKVTGLFTLVQTFSRTGEVDMRESAREILRLMGERDTDRFLVRKDEVAPKDPEKEWEELSVGLMPIVSPRENIMQHLQAHMVQQQVAMQTWGPQDPRTMKLQAHLQVTMMAWQQQMAAMGGGGGGAAGQGPRMMQPTDSGAPGQPASAMQPAFSNLNEQRQQSNNGANGQAPGPIGTVPNRTVGAISTGGTRR